MVFVTLSSKGQVVLRREIRDKLGLKAGDKFIEFVKDDEVVLKPVRSTEELFGVLKDSREFCGKRTEEIVREIDEGWFE